MILTCELNKEKNTVEIVFNKDGILLLKEILEDLSLNNKETISHVHLKTKEWGGNELSSNVMGENNSIINHMKFILIDEPS